MIDAMREVVETHRADSGWRWVAGQPKPPAICDIRYQHIAAAGRNERATLRVSDLFGPPPPPRHGENPVRRIGAMVEVYQFVGWNQSVDDAKTEAERLLREEAATRRVALDDTRVGTDKPDDDGLVRAYAAGKIVGWLGIR